MNQEYAEYLRSKAWRQKRSQRLEIAKHRCAACGNRDGLHVHHLTYARIFNENMADLLPLCEHHHTIAEELVRKGQLPRGDDVLFLATETIRLILTHRNISKKVKQDKPVLIGPRIVLTKQLIRSAMSNRGGINNRQLQLLGIPWPPRKNWMRRLIGQCISKDAWDKVLLHRDNLNNQTRSCTKQQIPSPTKLQDYVINSETAPF